MEGTGVKSTLVEHEIFGHVSVKSAMSGGDYIKGKHAMSNFADALQRLQFQRFLELLEQSPQIGISVKRIQDASQEAVSIPERVKFAWGECTEGVKEVLRMFSAFRKQRRNCSEKFLYWDNFLTQIFTLIRDLIHSHREKSWELHFSAISRALPLRFAFDKMNNRRWLRFYYEDVVAIKERFPNMHAQFSMGDFTVKHTKTIASALPVDQAL